jgi:hypothetical protein
VNQFGITERHALLGAKKLSGGFPRFRVRDPRVGSPFFGSSKHYGLVVWISFYLQK